MADSITLAVYARASARTAMDPPPLYLSPIHAGRPADGEASIEERLDLNAYCVQNPPATFFLRVEGDALHNKGIHTGDLLIVDRSRELGEGRIVIAVVDGVLTVRTITVTTNRVNGEDTTRLLLVPAHQEQPVVDITNREEEYIWGVVTHVLHKVS